MDKIKLLLDSGSERLVSRIRNLPEAEAFELLTYVGEDPKAIGRLIGDADAIYIYQHDLTGADIAAAASLRFIQKHGVNCKNIDLAAAARRGIPVATLPLFRNVAVAEHAFALMLACAHKIVQGHRAVAEGVYRDLGLVPALTAQRDYKPNWAKIGGVAELMHANVGIIGLGDIGMELARRCRAFGMTVLYHQRTRHSEAVEKDYEATWLPLDDLLRRVDHLVLVLPHTPQTEGMIGAREFALMKPGATLINVARGGVVDEAALVAALQSGSLAMAGLDVFRHEPLPFDSPLAQMANVVLTPHIGGGSYRSHEIDHRAGIANILRFFRGEPPDDLVTSR